MKVLATLHFRIQFKGATIAMFEALIMILGFLTRNVMFLILKNY